MSGPQYSGIAGLASTAGRCDWPGQKASFTVGAQWDLRATPLAGSRRSRLDSALCSGDR